VEKSLRINASIAWPACAVLASLSTHIIAHVFTAKWFPAQPLLYAYCINAVMSAVGLPLSELFFAQDDAWFNLRLGLWWAILTWTLGTYAVYHYGLLGFTIFQAALQSTWLLAFFHARKPEGLRVFAPLREPLFLSAGGDFFNLPAGHRAGGRRRDLCSVFNTNDNELANRSRIGGSGTQSRISFRLAKIFTCSCHEEAFDSHWS
jgi:hypothetical protein